MSTIMEKNRALAALASIGAGVETYHVATFDHIRAAKSLHDDLCALEVDGTILNTILRDGKSDGGAVWVKVPAGTDLDQHLAAVKAISLGRGSHTVTRERA